MKTTYVFDFCNLYIQKSQKYVNKKYGIRIVPLKIAEEFEKNRKKSSSPHHRYGWIIAKCYITSNTESRAKQLAHWLEFIYSFAQSRRVFFPYWYKHNWGHKRRSFESIFIESIDNGASELIYGTRLSGSFFSRDITFFVDNAIETLDSVKSQKLDEIMVAMHAYITSQSEMAWELRFLTEWCSLERLANMNYIKYKSKKSLFSKKEIKEIKKEVWDALDKKLAGHKRLNFLKNSLAREFLYEHHTLEKIKLFLLYMDLGFEKKKLVSLFKILVNVRNGLVHNLQSAQLGKQPYLLFYLYKVMEKVILRKLGISPEMEQRLILQQYNRGTLL